MMSLFQLLLDTAQPAQPQGGIFGSGLMFPVLLVVMMYFLLFRPQQQQRKEMEKRVAALQKGDRVITGSGIHALVHNVGEKTVTLKVAEGVMMEFEKQAVATVIKKETAAPASSTESK